MSQKNPAANDLPQTKPGKENEKVPSFLIPIFKLPVFLYRLRLGWLLGKRFMQITHVGRHSGKVRRTILAVLRFDEKTKEIYAVSAWKGSDWYYNIQASPALQVETGFIRYAPAQRTLSPEEITTTFIEYRQHHPIFSRMVCRTPAGNGIQPMRSSLNWHARCTGWHSDRNKAGKAYFEQDVSIIWSSIQASL